MHKALFDGYKEQKKNKTRKGKGTVRGQMG
jgi:hypothetical protein